MRFARLSLLFLVSGVLGALGCAAEAPPPAAPPSSPNPARPAGPAADQEGADRAAQVALVSLAHRAYSVRGCAGEPVRIGTEAELADVKVVDGHCAVRVARRADGQWLVVVRSPTQLGNVWANVVVSRGGEGVTKVEYKGEAPPP